MIQIEIDSGDINSKQDFMKAMSRSFGVPVYFGENWDALWDMMRDLFWIEETEIVLTVQNNHLLPSKLKLQIVSFFDDLISHLENTSSEKSFRYVLL